jgi:hypothetical protein
VRVAFYFDVDAIPIAAEVFVPVPCTDSDTKHLAFPTFSFHLPIPPIPPEYAVIELWDLVAGDGSGMEEVIAVTIIA